MTMHVVLLHAEAEALTVSWPKVEGALRYILQFRNVTEGFEHEFQTLSNKLAATQARKKNLVDESGLGFEFRVGAVKREGDEEVDEWFNHPTPFRLLSTHQEANRMAPPKVNVGGTSYSALVAWKEVRGHNGGYEIQMRENIGGVEWKTIAPSFVGSEVRKKNLKFSHGYQFRVRPFHGKGGASSAFSPPSDVVIPFGLSHEIKHLFSSLEDGTLLKGDIALSLDGALGGKEFILLYASAGWCGPCRSFTPQLAKWYSSMPAQSRPVEIVFLSADRNEDDFKAYYNHHMPWLAVDYDDDTREQLMAYIRVTGIPRLVVLDGRTGRIVEDNAVGQSLDINRWRKMR